MTPPGSSDSKPQAAKTATDPGAQQIATVYAKAFLAAIEAGGQADAALDELTEIQENVLEAFPRLGAVLSSGFIDIDEKLKILDRTFGTRASPLVLNFLKVLARHDRLSVLAIVVPVAREMFEKSRGMVRVEVSTAQPLTDAQTAKITEQLRGMLGGEPLLTPQVQPDLIGGVVLRVGDAVYDGSVAAALSEMRGRIINRSVHEIQSRRDRFSNPGGN